MVPGSDRGLADEQLPPLQQEIRARCRHPTGGHGRPPASQHEGVGAFPDLRAVNTGGDTIYRREVDACRRALANATVITGLATSEAGRVLDLGGDSIGAMRIASQVTARWRMDLSPAEILEADTVAEMPAALRGHLIPPDSGRRMAHAGRSEAVLARRRLA